VISDIVGDEATSRPLGRPSKIGLNDVIRTALRIADGEGLAAVSMRRLADELGVGPTTLYNHVASKADLVAKLRAAVLQPLEVNIRGNGRWQDKIFAGLVGLYLGFREHPSGIDLIYTSPPIIVEPGHRQILHNALAVLRSAGFTEERAIDTLTALHVYVAGVVSHELVQIRRTKDCASRSRPAPITRTRWRSCKRPRPGPDRSPDTFESGLTALIEAYAARYCAVCTPKRRPRPAAAAYPRTLWRSPRAGAA
jgi:AcrR family transcriptional regulator